MPKAGPDLAADPVADCAHGNPPGADPRSYTLRFQTPVVARSVVQLVTSFGGFFGVCAAMYAAVLLSVWVALPLSVVAAGFLVRIFIIQHRSEERRVGKECR